MDPEAAEIVREAFRLCVKGYGVSQIASEFMARKLLNPTAYAKSQGRNVPDNRDSVHEDYHWTSSTGAHMLTRPEYLGHLINFKTHRKSYKNKKILKNDPSQWQIFENNHEAIIDQDQRRTQKAHSYRRNANIIRNALLCRLWSKALSGKAPWMGT